MTQLSTDPAALSKAAANFEGIADDLKTVIARVQSTATGLDQHWKGKAADAGQAALQRFNDAATAQVAQLNDISNKIATAGVQYSVTDDERGQALQRAMDMDGGNHHVGAAQSVGDNGNGGKAEGAASPVNSAANAAHAKHDDFDLDTQFNQASAAGAAPEYPGSARSWKEPCSWCCDVPPIDVG